MKTTVSKLADIKTHTQPIECLISAWVEESILPFSLGTMGILLCFAYAWQSIKVYFFVPSVCNESGTCKTEP